MGKSKKERRKNTNNPPSETNTPKKELSKNKRRLFSFLTFLLPLVLLLLLESGLRLFNYGMERSLFVSTPDEHSPYYGINLDIGKRYFKNGSFSPSPRKDLFLKEKADNCYRIFFLGGSTAAGFPYGNNLTPSRILQRRLTDTFPDKKIEVVNVAMTAVNSYTLADFMDEILEQKPDLLLIYAGHNEFYGAMGVSSMESIGQFRFVVKTYLYLQSFKTFELMQNTLAGIFGLFAEEETGSSDPLETQMAKMVRDKEIPLAGAIYNTGKEQFSNNLAEIFEKAADVGVKVIVSELISNIRDHRPFVSLDDDAQNSADRKFEAAQELEKKGMIKEAQTAYYRAKDLDALRFRASEEFNELIHQNADLFDIPVITMKHYFESISANGLIGNNLILEHLHPNKKGYFVMASAFFSEMEKNGFIEKDWPKEKIKPVSYYMNSWGFSALDSSYAALNVRQLKGGWPFKKSGPNTTLKDFKPLTVEDSIALEIILKKTTLELGHMHLAEYFEKKGAYQKAFKEHMSLIYTVPQLDVFYELQMKFLLRMEQYNLALGVLYEAIKYNDSEFINKWLGQMNLILNKVPEGIKFLEIAYNKNPGDNQVVYNLVQSYYTSGQFDKGDFLLKKLAQRSENTEDVQKLSSYRSQMQGR